MKPLLLLAIVAILAIPVVVIYDLNGHSLDLTDRQVVLVVTDSMNGNVYEYEVDSFPPNTLAIIESVPAHEVCFIRVGEVAAYHSDGKMITHRVIGIDTDRQILIVKGDNSTVEEEVPFADVVGVVSGTNHVLGMVVSVINDYLMLILFAISIIIAGLAAHSLSRQMKRIDLKMTRRHAGLAVAVAILLGASLVGIGYSYTTYTMNGGNDATSSYVVLTQTNYTFVADGDFEYYSMTGYDGTTRYCIVSDNGDNPVTQLYNDTDRDLAPSVHRYYGIKIGESSLILTRAGFDSTNLMIKVEMVTDSTHYFTEYDTSLPQWKYFMKVYYMDGPTPQDVHMLWSDGLDWYTTPKEGDSDGYMRLDSTKTYKVELYFGGPQFTFGGKDYAGSTVRPLGNDGSPDVIKDGCLKFVFDSTPTITFNKNNPNATGSMDDQVVDYKTSATLSANGYSLTGYTFNGWNTKADGSGTTYSDTAEISIDHSIVLYAKWQKN